MSDELQLGKYEFFPYDDELSKKLKELEGNNKENSDVDLEELLERLSNKAKSEAHGKPVSTGFPWASLGN